MNKRKLKCLFLGHDFAFVSRTADWLFGGTYTYQCTRCDKVIEAQHYQGGF